MPPKPPSRPQAPASFSGDVGALAETLNAWAEEHQVFPISGQASRGVTVRNLRYYRSLALLDGPVEGGGYGPKHFLQVAAIRLLQARGLPLARIRDLLYGRSEKELHHVFREGVGELHRPPSEPLLFAAGDTGTVHGLPAGFALIVPANRSLTATQLEAISHVLDSANAQPTREP